MKKPEYDLLGVWLDLAFKSLVAELNRSLHGVGLPLNHAQFTILQNLFIEDGRSQSDIARNLGKDRAAISRSLNTLEENGFIIRRGLTGSKNGIFLTEKAVESQDKIIKAINMATLKARGGMTKKEYDNGMMFLNKIYKQLQITDN